MERRSREDIIYLLRKIVIPIGFMVAFSFLGDKYIVIDIQKTISEYFHLNIAELSIMSTTIFKCGFLFVAQLILYRTKIVKDSVFADGINGEYPMIIYRIARLIGYKKLSLIHMPIPLQFRLIDSRLFPEYIYMTEEYQNKPIEYDVKEVPGEDSSQLNIVIYDTYKKNNHTILDSIKQFKTIEIARKDNYVVDGQRIFSENLLRVVQDAINSNKEIRVFNLLLYTNPFTNIKLYREVFNTNNDSRELNIYYADRNTHNFIDKKEVINC